mgnify:CR=1 FL=1
MGYNRNETKTHKISVLIGNGFDIQVLNHFNESANTTYSSFYNFISWKYGNKIKDNLIVQKMEEDKKLEKENWSDFENTIKEILKTEYEKLFAKSKEKEDEDENEVLDYIKNLEVIYIECLNELRDYFHDFLNIIVTRGVLNQTGKLGKIIKKKGDHVKISLPLNTTQFFHGDLTPDERAEFKFVTEVNTNDIIDFKFFNFNYTHIFDNYIKLDKDAFEKKPHSSSENNFYLQEFQNKRKKETSISKFTKKNYEIYHPHGDYNDRKTMLFGFDSEYQVIGSDVSNNDMLKKEFRKIVKNFVKPKWVENNNNYEKYLIESNLYIIFGHSIGASDRYWWKSIADNLKNKNAELIIYNFTYNDTNEEKMKVKFKFLVAAGWDEEETVSDVLKNIFVVNFNSEKPRYAFNVDANNLKS